MVFIVFLVGLVPVNDHDKIKIKTYVTCNNFDMSQLNTVLAEI